MSPHIIFLLNKSLESIRNSKLDSAEQYLKQASQLQKNNPHVLRLQGIIFAKRKKYSEALKYLTKSLKFLPENAVTLSNMGNIYLELGDYDKALQAYDSAIKINPNYDEVWTNKGILLGRIHRLNEALDHHQKAINLNPNYAEAWSNKGNILQELKYYEDALTHYDRALSLKRDYAEAWYQKAKILSELKCFSESIFHYEKAISLDPSLDWIYGNLIHTKMQICDWSFFEEIRCNIRKKITENKKVTNPFILMSLFDDISLHQLNNSYVKDIYPSNWNLGPILKQPLNNKIRIGYYSADFHDHPVSHLTSQLFEMHDRNRFEIIAFSLQKSPPEDDVNQRLRKAFDKFIEVDDISDQEVARLSRDLKIDIAIDLSGHTKNSRPIIFSYRAAPIQVNWLGFPGSLGLDHIDYIIADKTIIPEEYKNFYSEKVIYLPDTYMVDDTNRVASSKIYLRKECGLPEDKFVFCCFNNFYKFNPSILDSWARIFLKVKNSVLWVAESNEQFQAGLLSEFKERGIDSNRIIFAPREALMSNHLARQCLADLFLDTFPYNAHTTALDSLKAGVPVLTRIGQSFPSRVAASLLRAIDLSELVTNTLEEYEKLAIDLAQNHEKLSAIKRKLANNTLSAPLFNTELFTKNIETAYLKIYERYQSGRGPDHLSI